MSIPSINTSSRYFFLKYFALYNVYTHCTGHCACCQEKICSYQQKGNIYKQSIDRGGEYGYNKNIKSSLDI